MSLINIVNLTFAYDGSYDNIFNDVSFQIDTDWKLGFIGRNGRGKTTFLKLLMNEHEYKGQIQSTVVFEYFPYPVPKEFADLDTIDVIMKIEPEIEMWAIIKELSLMQVKEEVLYRSFGTLSHGERTKILLAILFIKENRFLLIDEPTNHLDTEARQSVSSYLKKKKGFILVSHDRNFVDNCVDHVLSINKAKIEIQKGNFSTWQQNKFFQDQFEIAENEKLKNDIHQLTLAVKRTSGWSDQVEQSKYGKRGVDRGYIGHKSAKMMKRSKAIAVRRERALEEKSKLLKDIEVADPIELIDEKHFSEKLIEVNGLCVGYAHKKVLENLSLNILAGERVVIKGKNGSGKSTLIKALAREMTDSNRNIHYAKDLKVSYVPQDTSHLRGDLQAYAKECGIEPHLMKSILSKFDFSHVQFEKDMSNYSEGQKKKVLLARSICERAHVYIWDEPLNYVDVLSRIQIENMIQTYQPTMIFVEHDEAFVSQIATREIEL